MNPLFSVAAPVLSAAIALSTTVVPARAQDCRSSCSRYEEGKCIETVESCSETGGTAHAPGPSFGAIAYSRTGGAWGYSYHWESQEKAEEVAKENCAQNATDCEIIVWFDRRCGAVASGNDGVAFSGLGYSAVAARDDARNKCLAAGNTECEIEVSQCSR
jgi:hypothetical protein